MSIKKEELEIVGYILGIISIVLAFFTPFAGLVFGIIGYVQSKKQKSELSKKAKKLNTIGIILSAIFLIISITIALYLTSKGITNFGNFPIV